MKCDDFQMHEMHIIMRSTLQRRNCFPVLRGTFCVWYISRAHKIFNVDLSIIHMNKKIQIFEFHLGLDDFDSIIE